MQATDYFPYGGTNVDEKYGSFANPYTYTGKERDEEVDLYYYGARYYNAGFSRFTSIDPALFDAGYLQQALSDPQRLNSYSYAKNNPIRFIDPNGATAVDWVKGLLYGAWNGVETIIGGLWDIAKGTWSFMKDPKATSLQAYEALKSAISNYSAVLDAIADEIYNSYDTLAFGSDYDSGYKTGQLVMGLVAGYAADKGLGSLADLAEDSKKIQSLIQIANRIGSKDPTKIAVLGKNPYYKDLADMIGANKLDIPDNVWQKMTREEKWTANKIFLDRAVARGDDFVLATNGNEATGMFKQEIDYLKGRGYEVSQEGFELIKKN